MLNYKGKRILVLGLGDTGLSMTRWLTRHGAEVSVADSRANPPHAALLAAEMPGVALTGGAFDDHAFHDVDLIAISPGIDRRERPIAAAAGRGVPIVGDVELFAQALATLNTRQPALSAPKVLAITGSNGKSTVTAMAGDMCRAAGLTTLVAGNIGLPVLDALAASESDDEMPQAYVLELSSFQLESTESLRPAAATMLNLSEDHLDRYDGMAGYAAAKARIFNGDGRQVLNRDDRWSIGMALPGRETSTFGLGVPGNDTEWGIRTSGGAHWLAQGARCLMPIDELPVAGLHNAANALAALALVRAIELPEVPLLEALRHYQGLPHRVQKVAEIGGVAFFDDSKGTNVGATVAALNGLAQSVVLIAGGDGKGQDFSPLAPAVARHARSVVLIGRDAGMLAHALASCGVPLVRAHDMDDAVQAAFKASRPGDAVVLSPACASYDMFRNYVHRAEVFVRAVTRLSEGRT